MPFTAAKLRLGAAGGAAKAGEVSYILAKASHESLLERAKIGTALLLRQRHRVAARAIAGFRVSDPAAVMQARYGASRTIGWLLAAIAFVSLVVGGISIMNIMLVSVSERTSEIGLRMALGADRRSIGFLFLVEASLICILGGTIGVGLGVAASWLIAKFAGWTMLIAPSAILAALTFATLTGLMFGYYPARLASRLLPATALRHS